jgi:hypothetical protein
MLAGPTDQVATTSASGGALRLRDGRESPLTTARPGWVVARLIHPATADPGGAEPEPGPRSSSFVRRGAPVDRGPEPGSTGVRVGGDGMDQDPELARVAPQVTIVGAVAGPSRAVAGPPDAAHL